MSRDFDGVDDYALRTNVALGSKRTFALWFNPDTQGEGDQGHLISHVPAFFGRNTLRWDGVAASKKLRFTVDWTGTNGEWTMTSGFSTLSEWHFAAVTYDGGSASNDPVLWVSSGLVLSKLTVGSGLTRTTTPSGSEENTDNGDFVIGSDDSAGANAYDGKIGEVAAWASVLLSDDEITAIFLRGPVAIPGMYGYYKLDNGSGNAGLDYSGNGRDLTIVGAVAFEDPPIPLRSGHTLSA